MNQNVKNIKEDNLVSNQIKVIPVFECIGTERNQRLLKIKKLYKKAFPRNEKKPFFVMTRSQKKGKMEISSLENENFVGLGITVLYEDLVLLDYFAIHENTRGKGCGSESLAQLRKRYEGKRFFLEIEQPDANAQNNEERVRRKNFYLRNGMSETGIVVSLFGVRMELLCYDCELTFAEYYNVYKHILGNYIARKNVKEITK